LAGDAYYDYLLQQDYERGVFSPRGRKVLKSGLVVLYLVPPEDFTKDWEYDP
jgi:hypothetical protein